MKTEYRGHTITIEPDIAPMSPRDWDNLGIINTIHSRYRIGESHSNDVDDLSDIEKSDNFYSLPIYLYDHSGITIRTTPFGCPWDSGKIGIIYIPVDTLKKEFPDQTPEQLYDTAIKIMKSEVDIYDKYLKGDIWQFVTTTPCPHCKQPMHYMAVGGFYSVEEALEAAKEEIDAGEITPEGKLTTAQSS